MTVWWNDNFVEDLEQDAIWPVILDVAEKVLATGNNLILSGPKTGRIYTRKGRTHQASAPYEAPANDFGQLVASGHVIPDRANLTATVEWSAPYASYLQFGTSRMSERPFATMALTLNAQYLLTGLTASITRRNV